MDQALLVRLAQRRGDLPGQFTQIEGRYQTGGNPVLQAAGGQVREHDEGLSAMHPGSARGGDVWVIEPCHFAQAIPQALEQLGVAGELGGVNPDGNKLLIARILCFVDSGAEWTV